MSFAGRARGFARGPLRSALRDLQAGHPVLRPGRQPGPPDFVGIGTQRSGTSWWHSLITAHPHVAELGWGAKELHFFDRFWNAPFTDADIATYHRHFLRRPDEQTGEWTPRYMFDPWTLPLLRRAAPDARLLVMLRDPTARFASGINHAFKREQPIGPDVAALAFERGRYAAQLRRVLELVPRTQLLVLQFEQCVREPQRLLAATFEFLQLPPAQVDTGSVVNASTRSTDVPPHLLDEARHRYAAEISELESLLPGTIDRSLWS